MRVLEIEDVMSLLRFETKRAGGISAWSRKTGVHRTVVNNALRGRRALTDSIVKALKLRRVFVADDE
jgi:hypothetical protein